MGGIEDYIKWRGDLTFEQSAFNEVDNLVLSQIAYVDFKNIIPAAGSKEKLPCGRRHMIFDLNDEEELQKSHRLSGKHRFYADCSGKQAFRGYCAFRLCRCDR